MTHTFTNTEVTFNDEELNVLSFAVARALSEFDSMNEETRLQKQLNNLSNKLFLQTL